MRLYDPDGTCTVTLQYCPDRVEVNGAATDTMTPRDNITDDGPTATGRMSVVFNNMMPQRCNSSDVSPNFDLDKIDGTQADDLNNIEVVDFSCNSHGVTAPTENDTQGEGVCKVTKVKDTRSRRLESQTVA